MDTSCTHAQPARCIAPNGESSCRHPRRRWWPARSTPWAGPRAWSFTPAGPSPAHTLATRRLLSSAPGKGGPGTLTRGLGETGMRRRRVSPPLHAASALAGPRGSPVVWSPMAVLGPSTHGLSSKNPCAALPGPPVPPCRGSRRGHPAASRLQQKPEGGQAHLKPEPCSGVGGQRGAPPRLAEPPTRSHLPPSTLPGAPQQHACHPGTRGRP